MKKVFLQRVKNDSTSRGRIFVISMMEGRKTRRKEILSLFLGSTSILWVLKFFLKPMEMVASPRQGIKIY